jgi:hypothetical protein
MFIAASFTCVEPWSHTCGNLESRVGKLVVGVCVWVCVCVSVCVCVCVSVCLCVCVSVCNLAVTCREVGAIQAFPAGPRLLVPLSFGEPYMKGHRASPPGTQCDSTGICSPGPSKLSPFLPCWSPFLVSLPQTTYFPKHFCPSMWLHLSAWDYPC